MASKFLPPHGVYSFANIASRVLFFFVYNFFSPALDRTGVRMTPFSLSFFFLVLGDIGFKKKYHGTNQFSSPLFNLKGWGKGKKPNMTVGLTITDWGPSAWNFLHVVSHRYPISPNDDDKLHMLRFLRLFALHLPCPTCKQHFQGYLKDNLPGIEADPLRSRKNLVSFMNEAHNTVNRRLGKREFTLEEHNRAYSLQRHTTSPKDSLRVALMVACAYYVATRIYKRSLRA